MSDLVEFLKARLDEDEQTARAAGESRIAWLTYRDDEGQMRYTTVAAEAADGAWIAEGSELPAPASALVVYDPARVLREVEAKRRILERHRPEYRLRVRDGAYVQDEDPYCPDHLDGRPWPCADVRDMAAAYADHPDYREEWRP